MYDGLYAFVPATGELRRVPLPTGRHGNITVLRLHKGALWFGRGLDPGQVIQLPQARSRQPLQLVWQHPHGLLGPSSSTRWGSCCCVPTSAAGACGPMDACSP